MVGIIVAYAVSVGDGATAVWVSVEVGVWLAVAVGVAVWLGTAVGSKTVGVADASILATWAGMAASCGGREQPDPRSSPNIMSKGKRALRNVRLLIVDQLIPCRLPGIHPAVNFHHIGKAQFYQGFGCLGAHVAAAAVENQRRIFIRRQLI